MSIEKVREHFTALGIADRIMEFDVSSATVELAAIAVGVEGAVFDKKIVAIFATSRERATKELSCKTAGSDKMSYYVSGVAEGEWTVTVDGDEIGSFEASAEGGLLTFTAPAGKVIISPKK